MHIKLKPRELSFDLWLSCQEVLKFYTEPDSIVVVFDAFLTHYIIEMYVPDERYSARFDFKIF